MQLHTIVPTHKKNQSRRIGRGGKRGTYSGRGVKGQKSRSGRRIRPAQRDLIMRIPKLRGFRNQPLSPKPFVLNLQDISALSGTIDRAALEKAGFLIRRTGRDIKILGGGEVTHPLVIKGCTVSAKARAKIEAAGGRIEQ